MVFGMVSSQYSGEFHIVTEGEAVNGDSMLLQKTFVPKLFVQCLS